MRQHLLTLCTALIGLSAMAGWAQSGTTGTAAPTASGAPELVANFYGPMPTGVSVSHHGRVFVNFPRWGDKVPYTVAELKNGKTVPYPDLAYNEIDRHDTFHHLIGVQSIVVDPKDRLWILDTGSVQFGPTQLGGPKLVGVDLATNKVFKTIYFPRSVVPATGYLNDVRFDLRRGHSGMAFMTDSGEHGPNGIVVADLGTGKSWRRLAYHPTSRAEYHFLPIVEGKPLMNRPRVGPPSYLKLGSDGIAISADGKRLYYCPLASRHLYSVSVDALADPKTTNAQVVSTIKDEGIKGASDGLESDAAGYIYATDYEHHQIKIGTPGGPYTTFVVSPHIYDWPDTMSIATNGYLYWNANQLQRMAGYHYGQDLRKKPYSMYRVKLSVKPVLLR